jgi:hypothetical protein
VSTNGVISTRRRRRRQHSELLRAEAVGACQEQRPDIHPTYEWGHWLLWLAKGDRDAALIEMERVNVVDGRQLGLAPI